MPVQRSLAKLFSYSSIIVISFLTLIICVFLISDKYRNFNAEADKIEKKFFRAQLLTIKSKVNDIIEYIDYNKSLAEEVLKDDIKRRVHEAYQIALALYENNETGKSRKEIKKIIKDALRAIRFNKGRGYYFIDDINRNIILYPPERGLEDKPAPGDSIKNFVELVKSQGEGFTYYNWYKPGQKEILNKKITYIKLFEPYKWIIGTGEYLDEVEKDIREKVIKRIKNTRFGKDSKNYIFMSAILSEAGGDEFVRVIANPKAPDLVGQVFPETLTDVKGDFFYKKIVDLCLQTGEAEVGFWEVGDSGEPVEKISYSRLYKGWNWIVSSGFYPADLEKIVSRNKKILRNTVRNEIILIIAAFILILLFALLVSHYFSKNIKNEFGIFANFFKESAKKNEFLDKEKLTVTELRELAESANKMIGDKKTGEEALLKAKEIAEAATRLKSEFLTNVSHEIRTPMNAIIGMSEILAQTELKTDQQEYLEIINSSAINLLGIINDILDVSKMESGKVVLEQKIFDIRDVFEGTTDLVTMEAYDKELELITFIDPEIPEKLVGDSARLNQVLLNLVNNAVKFTEEGEIFLSAEIAKERKNDIVLLFKTKDTGIGISEAGKKRLFKTFSQIDGTLTRKYEGAGLGLALSKHLTGLMKGEIGVESEYGSGSTFRFTARFKKVPPGKVHEPKPAPPAAFKGLRILIVDDNRTSRLTLRKYLEYWGIVCEDAKDALEAFSRLQSAVDENMMFDIALIDYDMPEISGVQIAKMIKDSSEIKDTKLVFLAPAINFKERDKEGIDGVVHKPVKQGQLHDCIATVMKIADPPGKRKTGISREFIDRMRQMPDRPLDILLVEDNYFNRKVIVYSLEKFGHRIDIAKDGKAGVEKYKKGEYDLILMDVQMPVMDGYEATRTIRRLEKETAKKSGKVAHIPIVAMTAHVTSEDEKKSFKSGMDAHLTKPFNVEKFIDTITVFQDTTRKTEPRNGGG
jgi:signal transduction histidine kinase/DNA-binding response OmpR family regulator